MVSVIDLTNLCAYVDGLKVDATIPVDLLIESSEYEVQDKQRLLLFCFFLVGDQTFHIKGMWPNSNFN